MSERVVSSVPVSEAMLYSITVTSRVKLVVVVCWACNYNTIPSNIVDYLAMLLCVQMKKRSMILQRFVTVLYKA